MSYLNFLREHYSRFFSFQVVGWSGTVINLAALWLMHGVLRWHLLLSGAIAIEIAIIWNFVLYYNITWKDRKTAEPRRFFKKLIRYNTVTALIDFAVRLTVLWVLTEWAGVNYLLADIMGMIIAPLFKYYANDKLIFKERKEQIAENYYDI